MNICHYRIIGVLTFVALPFFLKAQSAQEIVYAYISKVSNGDIRNWDKIKTVYIESKTLFNDRTASAELPSQLPKVLTQKLYREWPDKSMTEVYDDTIVVSRFYHVKKSHFLVLRGMEPIETSAGVYEPYFEFDPVLINRVMSKAKSIELLDDGMIEGISYAHVRIVTRELTWDLYFDRESHLLMFWSNFPEGKSGPLTKLSDYQQQGDFLIPMAEDKYNNESRFFWSRRMKIEFNITIPPNQFDYKNKTNIQPR